MQNGAIIANSLYINSRTADKPMRACGSVALLLLAGCFAAFLAYPPRVRAQPWPMQNPVQICNAVHLKKSVFIDGVQFRSYKNDESGEACLQVIQGGKLLFERTNDNNGYFTLGQQGDEDRAIAKIPDGTDITGRGYPDMVVSQWTGGAHCCRLDYVFELRPKARLLAELDAKDADESHFVDLDGNGRYYYLTADYTFAYWWQSFAGSPVHPVVLRFIEGTGGGSYHMALEKMSRPAPSKPEWDDALARVGHELQLNEMNIFNDLPDVLWQEVMDLIYTGHADLAWTFLRQVGPKAQEGALPDLTDFCSTLKTSPYWPDLRGMMQGAPPSCLKAKPRSR